MADPVVNAVPLSAVQVDALVVMKITKHCSSTFPTIATGSLVGMDVNGILEVTNTFPFPTIETQPTDGGYESASAAASQAAAAPRAKANLAYQAEMIKMLREVNVDSANVGWYMSANMGNFVTLSMIENQFFYQKDLDERTVALVYDTSRSTMGSLSLKAFRLSPTFVAAYKEGKFTTESLQKHGLSYRDIVIELPVVVRNSSLLNSYLHQLPVELPAEPPAMPNSLSEFATSDTAFPPLDPNRDALDLSIDPFLEKTCDLLLDSLETHNSELNNQQYYQRQLGREQAKIATWQQKRKAENAARVAAKQTPLPEDEWTRLFKLPQEPSRLDSLLNSRQIEQYSRQVDGFTAGISAKMFAVKGNLLPGEARQ